MASRIAAKTSERVFVLEVQMLLDGNGPNFETRDAGIKARIADRVDEGIYDLMMLVISLRRQLCVSRCKGTPVDPQHLIEQIDHYFPMPEDKKG